MNFVNADFAVCAYVAACHINDGYFTGNEELNRYAYIISKLPVELHENIISLQIAQANHQSMLDSKTNGIESCEMLHTCSPYWTSLIPLPWGCSPTTGGKSMRIDPRIFWLCELLLFCGPFWILHMMIEDLDILTLPNNDGSWSYKQRVHSPWLTIQKVSDVRKVPAIMYEQAWPDTEAETLMDVFNIPTYNSFLIKKTLELPSCYTWMCQAVYQVMPGSGFDW